MGTTKKTAEVIGRTTHYVGSEHSYLTGFAVRVVAVLRGGDDEDGEHITDDERLAAIGGVRAGDRVEVQPWIEREGRFSWVTSDAMATDMECFQHLAGEDA